MEKQIDGQTHNGADKKADKNLQCTQNNTSPLLAVNF